MWNWGAVGVTLLTFAAFRPARDVLAMAAVHSAVAIAATATALGQPGAGSFSLLVVANAAATPALAAAQYLNLYVKAVRLRDRATAVRRQAEMRNAASQAVQEDAAQRLKALQAEIMPLLAAVADSSVGVNDPQVAQTARRLATGLRAELVEARSGRWLLPAPSSAGAQDRPPGHWPGVVLLDPSRLLGRLHDADRAALIALLGMLRTHSGWQRVSVGLAPGDDPTAGTSLAALSVVAQGASAMAAATNADVIAAASRLNAVIEADSGTMLVAETHLAVAPGGHTGPHEWV
jgi:hypothetical protein